MPNGWGPGNTWIDEGEIPSGALRSSGIGTVKDLRRRCRHIIIYVWYMHAYITHLEYIEIWAINQSIKINQHTMVSWYEIERESMWYWLARSHATEKLHDLRLAPVSSNLFPCRQTRTLFTKCRRKSFIVDLFGLMVVPGILIQRQHLKNCMIVICIYTFYSPYVFVVYHVMSALVLTKKLN